MDQKQRKPEPSFRWFTNLAAGCLMLLFVVSGYISIFFYKPFQNVEQVQSTLTPIITSIPHILVHQPADKSEIIKDDFASNRRNWGLFYPNGKIEVFDGRLILQANAQNEFAIGRSKEIELNDDTYYVQADFTTDVEQSAAFGLIFGFNEGLGTYYMFEISHQAGYFRLLKYNSGIWTELMPFTEGVFNPYPEFNTLSVFFDKGVIELYINGNLVSTYTDNEFFQSKGVGVFTVDNGYRLIVDNFITYSE